MGYANATLIRDLARAVKKGNEREKARLGRALEAFQRECPHDPRDSKTHKIPEDSGRFKKGGTLDYCIRCSGLVKYYPPGTPVPKHRPTSWEAILLDDLG